MVEQGYLLGLLSVLDAVLDVSLENLAKEFSLDGALSGALLNARGMLGQTLNLAQHVNNASGHSPRKFCKPFAQPVNRRYCMQRCHNHEFTAIKLWNCLATSDTVC